MRHRHGNCWVLSFQMGMSPSRMPQAQGMMAAHFSGNMVGQTSSQGQFLPQTQFPTGAAVTATGAMSVTVGPGLGQAPAQAAVTQVGARPDFTVLFPGCR